MEQKVVIENDPLSRLKFRCHICLSTTLVMIADDGQKTEVLDLFPSLDDENCNLQIIYEDTSFNAKTPVKFCCGGCDLDLKKTNEKTVENCQDLINWLKHNRMIDG